MKSFKEIRDELAAQYGKHIVDTDAPGGDKINIGYDFSQGFDAADKLHREAAQILIDQLKECECNPEKFCSRCEALQDYIQATCIEDEK
jgi:hypothetical protein